MKITLSLHMGDSRDMTVKRELDAKLTAIYGPPALSKSGKTATADYGPVVMTQLVNRLTPSGPVIVQSVGESGGAFLYCFIQAHEYERTIGR